MEDTSVIIIDSPEVQRGVKRAQDTEDDRSPKRPLLESVGQIFNVNRQLQSKKLDDIKRHRERELVHARHIRQNIASPDELRRASFVVSQWANKNAVNTNRKAGNAAWLEAVQQNEEKIEEARIKSLTPAKPATVNSASSAGGRNTNVDVVGNILVGSDTAPDDTNTSSDVIVLDDSLVSEGVDNGSFQCPVLNCSAVFSTGPRLMHHLNKFKHSPCDPCLKAMNGVALADTPLYVCPYCDSEFQSKEACVNHIQKYKHKTFLPPYTVTAYLCPQCLYIFPSYAACWQHMELTPHNSIAYPFTDDFQSANQMTPVPVCEELVQDYISKCSDVPFRVQCLECSLELDSAAALREHRAETNNQHVISSLTDTNLMDVFANYLAPYQCSHCRRLCSDVESKSVIHMCAPGVKGVIVENKIRKFTDFVKSCGLTVMESITPKPGTFPTRPTGHDQQGHNTENDEPFLSGMRARSSANQGARTYPQDTYQDREKTQPVRKVSRWNAKETKEESAQRGRVEKSHRSRSPPERPAGNPTDKENLVKMKNIVFLDLDNWPGFFSKLPRRLPEGTFVWGFFGGAMNWREPFRCYVFNQLKQDGGFYLNEKCGTSKDAADFAIVLTVGKMEERLPKTIPFTILSGDKGFCEVERQMKDSERQAVVIDPHRAHKFSNDMIYTMVTSVMDK